MKILIYALNFAPELVGCARFNTEMAESLSEYGHEVRVICAPPYYPQWAVQKPFSPLIYSKVNDGRTKMQIIRCPLYVPRNPGGMKRLIHLFSFAVTSIPAILAQVNFKPDLVFTVAPTLFCAPAASLVARLTGAVSWLHIQDFETDAAFEIGFLKNPLLAGIARTFEKVCFSQFSIISTISRRMLQKLHEKGVSECKTWLFPNWVDADSIFPSDRSEELLMRLKILSDRVLCLFSGNLGVKQGLEMIIAAARKLKPQRNIHFLICGNGPQKTKLSDSCKDLDNISFSDLFPPEELNELLNLAHVHLLPQLGNAADLVMPSKLTGMLASGRPVVAAAAPDTEIHATLQNCGLTSMPGDTSAFADNILKLVNNTALRHKLGQNARIYAEKNLSRKQILESFNQKILQTASQNK